MRLDLRYLFASTLLFANTCLADVLQDKNPESADTENVSEDEVLKSILQRPQIMTHISDILQINLTQFSSIRETMISDLKCNLKSSLADVEELLASTSISSAKFNSSMMRVGRKVVYGISKLNDQFQMEKNLFYNQSNFLHFLHLLDTLENINTTTREQVESNLKNLLGETLQEFLHEYLKNERRIEIKLLKHLENGITALRAVAQKESATQALSIINKIICKSLKRHVGSLQPFVEKIGGSSEVFGKIIYESYIDYFKIALKHCDENSHDVVNGRCSQ